MRVVLSTIVCIFIFALPSYAASDNTELRKYVQNLMNDAFKIFDNKSISLEKKINQSGELIEKNLNLDWMAKYSLGRNRKSLSPEKINEFVKVYSKFVVMAYANLTKHYNGEEAKILGIKQIDDDMFIAILEISNPNRQAVRVEYLVHQFVTKEKISFKISDIITEGISLLNSQQSEFNSVIQSHGIDGLINDLKTKINNTSNTNSHY